MVKPFWEKALLFHPWCVSCDSHKAQAQTQKRKVEMIMKTGKITAKLRDAVPVCLMVNGEEVKRYKNIELPEIFP